MTSIKGVVKRPVRETTTNVMLITKLTASKASNVAMGNRMAKDMIFDSVPAINDFGWNPKEFRPLSGRRLKVSGAIVASFDADVIIAARRPEYRGVFFMR